MVRLSFELSLLRTLLLFLKRGKKGKKKKIKSVILIMIKRWCLGALLDEVEFLKVILMLGFADFLLIFDFAYDKIEACQKSLSLIIFCG